MIKDVAQPVEPSACNEINIELNWAEELKRPAPGRELTFDRQDGAFSIRGITS
jgi:hypothetical protein